MKKISDVFQNIKSNYELKSLLTSSFSFIINIVFLFYNLIFGIIYNSVWNWSISIYYALLIIFRAVVLLNEKKWIKQDVEISNIKREKLFAIICWCMIIMDLSIIAPITLMSLSKRVVDIGTIPAITIASYTTYKVTLAIINYSKKKSKLNLSIKALRLITLKDAIVSILTLQNTLVITFGDSISMRTLTAISSAGLLIVLISLTILTIINKNKKRYF